MQDNPSLLADEKAQQSFSPKRVICLMDPPYTRTTYYSKNMRNKDAQCLPKTCWLNKSILRYAIRFGLIIAFAKAILMIAQQGRHQDIAASMVLYFVLSTILAIPLFFYKQERKRSGVAMDQIILLCTGLVVIGGMLHDQIAVRVSLEYYTIGHFPIPGIYSKALFAMIWGFLGTWWFGAGLGIVLALVACGGERPPFPIRRIFRISIWPLLGIEIITWLMATIGFYLTQQEFIGIGEFANLIPTSKHAAFMANWWANGTAYCLLLIGMFLLSRYIWQSRAGE